MRIGAFGHGLPHGVFAAIGIAVEDITTTPPVHCAIAAEFVEPFMDPFAVSLLHRLAAGALSELDAVVFLRESPGALPAFHYACEFERRGLLPQPSPKLVVLNLIASLSACVDQFNRLELQRLAKTLQISQSQTPRAVPPEPAVQPEGQLRQALLGAPLGNQALHRLVMRAGPILFDQQRADASEAAKGTDLASALSAQATNPYSARQPKDIYIPAITTMLHHHKIDRVVWQVDPHDDLWGWLAPSVKRACETSGAQFVDLGFLSRWPDRDALAPIAARLELGTTP